MVATKQPQGVMLDKGKRLVLKGKSVNGRLGSRVMSDSPVLFDHFLYKPGTFTSTGPFLNNFTYTSTGTAVTDPTVLAVGAANATGGNGGVLKLTTDDVQNTAEEIATSLLWEIDVAAPLVFEARLKVTGGASSASATRESFFGFADATTYTNGQPYTVTTASAITGTNVPADFCGFAISGVPTSGAGFNTNIDGSGTDGSNVGYITSIDTVDTYHALAFETAGIKGNKPFVSDSTGTTGAINDTTAYHVYRIEIDPQGYPRFFVDGRYGGTHTAPIDIDVPFGAYFTNVNKTGSAANTSSIMSIDYVYVGGASTWVA